jgi:GTP-binding protein EngB required for normal cell division
MERALSVLAEFAGTPAGVEAGLGGGELSAVRRSVAEALGASDPHVRVVLLGEFNSGKSTLVNALAGREVAAFDLFEMTSWIALYRPGATDRCSLLHVDGTATEMDLAVFHERCMERSWTKDELESIELVDVQVAGSQLPCVLIDPPGLGSVTAENEARLLKALELADLAMWLVDVEAIGGIREATLIRHLRGTGTPLEVVITKTDLLDEPAEELAEIKEYLSRSVDVSEEEIRSVAAAAEATQVGTRADDSVGSLRAHIAADVEPHRADLREEAARATHERARKELGFLLGDLEHWLEDRALEDDEQDVVGTIGLMALKAEVEEGVRVFIRDNFLDEHRPTIRSAVTSSPGSDPEQVRAALMSAIPADYLDRFWTRLVDEAGRLLRSGVGRRFGQQPSPKFDSAQIASPMAGGTAPPGPLGLGQLTRDDPLDASLKTGLGTAAAATAYAAWLGPAAGSVTLGAALTGVGIPVALLGVGVAYVVSSRRKSRDRQAEALVDELIHELSLGFEQAVLDGPLAEAISDVLAAVSAPASLNSALPLGRSATAWLADVRDIRGRLEQPSGWRALPAIAGPVG